MANLNVHYIKSKRGLPDWFDAPTDTNGNSLDLYISTYPIVVKHLITRLGNKKSIAELCCGIGASMIHFVGSFQKIIGIDNSDIALEYCRKNVENATVANHKRESQIILENLNLVKDINQLIKLLEKNKVEIVLYDIPWWYDHGDQKLRDRNPDIVTLIPRIREVTKNIVIYAPPNMDFNYFTHTLGDCEVERIFLNGEYDRNIVYFGGLINKNINPKVDLMQ